MYWFTASDYHINLAHVAYVSYMMFEGALRAEIWFPDFDPETTITLDGDAAARLRATIALLADGSHSERPAVSADRTQ